MMIDKKLAWSVVVGLAASLAGCTIDSNVADSTNDSEDIVTGKSQQALVPRAASSVVAPTLGGSGRRLVRTTQVGCPTVVGTGGSWLGSAIGNATDDSAGFCAYRWVSGGGAAPDSMLLDDIAVFDGRRGLPYNVADTRPTNSAATPAQLTTEVALSPSKPLGIVSKTTTTKAARGALGLTAGLDSTARSSGCDVCVSWEGNILWLVLPPEVSLDTLLLHSGGASYALNLPAGGVHYANVPQNFSGSPYLTW
ncbi:MAG TPA: hypothetical protein VM580_34190 [Labilithrix sp.]|nr:hypothetical protein [Labilithrix sp.]